MLRRASLRTGVLRAAAVARPEVPAARRAVVFGACHAFPASASSRSLSGSAFSLDPPEETIWPNQKPAEGVSYELNWSICGSGVVPLGKAFRNLRLPELAAVGGSSLDTSVPAEAVYATVEKQVKESLGSASTTLYVQDCALGTMLANEVPIRIVTDDAAAAAAFKTFCAAARTVPLPEYEEDVTVLLSSAASAPYIASSKAQKTVVMGGSFNTETLAKHVAAIASDSFLARGVLPMFGSGADNVVYLGAGFESGAVVQHGFSFSSAGFCRLYAEGGSLPNSLPMPKAVVMFANDATGAIPAASVLDAAQVCMCPSLCPRCACVLACVRQMCRRHMALLLAARAPCNSLSCRRCAACSLPC